MKYTYSDEEGGSDAFSPRQSNRNSGISTPAEPSGPTFTASGRQVRSRHGGTYGESMLSGQANSLEIRSIGGMDGADEDDEEGPVSRGRPRRAGLQNEALPKARPRKHIEGYNSLDSMDDESDAASSEGWDGRDDESEDHAEDDEEEEDVEMSDGEEKDSEEEEDDVQQSLVVSLRYMKSHSSPPNQQTQRDRAISKDRNPQPSMPSIAATNSNMTQPTSTQETYYGGSVSKDHSQPPSIPSDFGNHSLTSRPGVLPKELAHNAPIPSQDAAMTKPPANTTAASAPYKPDDQVFKDLPQPEHSWPPPGDLQ